MNDLPDVLDRLGKTPRELGSVQLHVEPVIRGEDGRAVATVWCQAAVQPLPDLNTLHVLTYSFRLPVLENGVVMTARLPLHVPAESQWLLFAVDSEVLDRANRVRPAWALRDTWEMPAIDTRGRGNLGAALLASMVTLPMGFVLVPASFGGDLNPIARPARVLKADQPPPGFIAEVVRGAPPPVSSVRWERVWQPGQELPEAAPALWGDPVSVLDAQAAVEESHLKRCTVCHFAGRRADFGGDRCCPQCGNPWD